MAKTNRFFKPSQSTYKSQFVPENLPTDVMTRALYAKQAKADKMMANSIQLGEWDQAALGDHDTKYVQAIKDEAQAFAQSAMNEDRTSPEFQRRYMTLVNKTKNDPNLKKVQSSVDQHKAHEENIATLKAAGQHDYAEAMDADYQYRLGEYTKEGGAGFEGRSLGDENILRGTDKFGELSKYYSAIKDSGGESIKSLGNGITYKDGWTGVGGKKIEEQMEKQFNLMAESRVGKQMRLETLGKMGLVESTYNDLPAEERAKVDEAVDGYMRNEFLEVGQTYIRGKSTTNKDGALNASRIEDMAATEGPMFVNTEEAALEKTKGATRDAQIKSLKSQEDKIKAILAKDDKSQVLLGDSRLRYEEQLNSISKQKVQLQKEHTAAYRTVNAVVMGELTEEEQLRFSLDMGVPAGDLSDMVAKQFASYTKVDLSNPVKAEKEIINNIRNLESDIASGALSPEELRVAQTMIGNQRSMKAIAGKYAHKVNSKWNAEFYTRGQGASTINIESITASTDKNSTMKQLDQAVQSNPTGFKFFNSQGDILTGEELKGRVTKFVGGEYTLGDAANSDNYGAKGVITYMTEDLDADGNIVLDNSGIVKMKTVTQTVTAVPQGANQQFNKDNIAKEYYSRADSYRRMGDEQSAQAAEQAARTYKMSDPYNQLRDFQQDENAPVTFIQARTPTEGGKSGISNVEVKKIGDVGTGGGYRVIFNGDVTNSSEVSTIDDVLLEIEQLTR